MTERPPQSRIDFERTLQFLVGRRIEAVTYFELAYEDDVPMWCQQSNSFDSLDFGLEMGLDDRSTFSMIWDTEFTQYNVSILRGPLVLDESVRRWNVGERWRSRSLLETPIVSADALWLPDAEATGGEYPQSVRLAFDSGGVVSVSAFESRDGWLKRGMMDHITVFFDEAEARCLVLGSDDDGNNGP